MKYLYLLAFLLPGAAFAQAQPWDTNNITWVLPTNCTTGETISACPITAVRLEESSTPTGTFRALVTLSATATSYQHVGVSAGQHCYRAAVDSANGPSGYSNVGCKTNTKPVGPPNPPVLTVADNLAMSMKKMSYGWAANDNVGIVQVGVACTDVSYGNGYYGINKADVQFYPGRRAPKNLAAHCSESVENGG